MKTLILIPSVSLEQGGPVEALMQFARLQQKDGDELMVASFDDPNGEAAREFPYPLKAFGPCHTFYGFTFKLIPWLKTEAPNFDIVVVHGIWQFHSFAARRALKKTGVPYVVYAHGMLDPGHNRLSRFKHIKKQLYWLLCERRVLRDAAAVFFATAVERTIAPQSFWPHTWNGEVVPYGVAVPPEDTAVQKAAFIEKFPHLRGRRLLLFLGRFDPKKGGPLLIQSFADLADRDPRVHLVMAGPGNTPHAAELKAVVPSGLVDRVTWTGMVRGPVKWGAFRCADAFIIPSHTENYCIAAVEALACGLPVLTSNRVNIHGEVVSSGAGYVQSDTLAGCERLITRWLETPPAVWDAMRAKARACFERYFEIDESYRIYRDTLRRYARNGSSSEERRG